MANPNWNRIKKEWEKGEKTLKELADKHDVSIGTLKSRKSRERWGEDATTDGNVATAAPKKKRKAQANRSGNPNPSQSFPKRNGFSRKHGLYSKYFNEEQIEILDEIHGMDFAEQLWMQIEIKFSAIIRMQRIMWVATDDDHLKEESGHSSSDMGDSVSYKVAFAYERYESYIKAQTRAMAEYRNLVKQYLEMTDEFDERRLKLEQMQAGIEKLKAESKKMDESQDDSPIEIVISRKGER